MNITCVQNLLVLTLLICASELAGQAPAALPELPRAPFVREHEAAIREHLEAARAELAAARELKNQADVAAAESGLSEEELMRRRESARISAEAVTLAESRVLALEAELKAAQSGPTSAQLAARVEYDRLVKLGDDALAALIAEPRLDRNEREGALARAIREAEEELARVNRLSIDSRDFDGHKSRLYERLNDLEKIDYELRWAEQRLKLAIDEYDYLVMHVFAAYVAYEERGLSATRALREARDVQLPLFAGSPAALLAMPQAARTATELNGLLNDIEVRVERRRGRLAADRLKFSALIGRLREVQQEIDVREDFKERLDQEVESLKERTASQPRKEAQSEPEQTESRKAWAEYQEFSLRIDELRKEKQSIEEELKRLGEERGVLHKLLENKKAVEETVSGIIQATERRIAALELEFTAPEGATDAQKASLDAARALYFPQLRLAALSEEHEAQLERESAARRDTRYAMTRIEVLERRQRRLQQRLEEINGDLLPRAEVAYRESLTRTAGERALRVVGVVLAAWLLMWLIRVISKPLIQSYVKRAGSELDSRVSDAQRGRTLITVMTATTRLVVFVVATLVILSQFDVDYGPLLVAAGGVSLAVGFGAQSLVKDFFAGFFILLEGQYSIGDVVEINGKTGTIENLNLRTTVIRSVNGDVHTVPNGQISLTTNQTKLWSRAVVDIGVAYEENVEDMIAVLDAVAKAMQQDEVWGRKVLDSVVVGVQSLGESAVVIRVLLKTRAGEQWGASREYQKRVKLKFDELGIEIPWPQRVVSYKSADEKVSAGALRKKRAAVMRFVRASRGESVPEEAELAAISIEERDRAATLAKLQTPKAADGAAKADPVVEAAGPSDAERLAVKLAGDTALRTKADLGLAPAVPPPPGDALKPPGAT